MQVSVRTVVVLAAMLMLAVGLVALQCPELTCMGCMGDSEIVAKQGGALAPAAVPGVLPSAFARACLGFPSAAVLTVPPGAAEPELMWVRLII